jgi:hypothetical protein
MWLSFVLGVSGSLRLSAWPSHQVSFIGMAPVLLAFGAMIWGASKHDLAADSH